MNDFRSGERAIRCSIAEYFSSIAGSVEFGDVRGSLMKSVGYEFLYTRVGGLDPALQ
jgi:hypothetical protein